MCGVVVLVSRLGLFCARDERRESRQGPNVMEDLTGYVIGMLNDDIGPKGPRYIGSCNIGCHGIGNLMGMSGNHPGDDEPSRRLGQCALVVG